MITISHTRTHSCTHAHTQTNSADYIHEEDFYNFIFTKLTRLLLKTTNLWEIHNFIINERVHHITILVIMGGYITLLIIAVSDVKWKRVHHNFCKSFCMDTMYVQLGALVVTTMTTTALQGIFQPYTFVELN